MTTAAATVLPPPILSTVLVDAALAKANWDECRDITIAHVRKLESELAQLRAAAAEYVAAVNGDIELDGTPDGLRRLQRAETALLVVLP